MEIPVADEYDDDATEIVCRGDLIEGRSCDDNNICTVDDVCITAAEYDDYSLCRGTAIPGDPCMGGSEGIADGVCVSDETAEGGALCLEDIY